MSSERPETTAERLNRTHPVRCDICGTPLDRTRRRWNLCPTCGHDNTGPEAHLIHRLRQGRAAG
jgi:rubrerythrin